MCAHTRSADVCGRIRALRNCHVQVQQPPASEHRVITDTDQFQGSRGVLKVIKFRRMSLEVIKIIKNRGICSPVIKLSLKVKCAKNFVDKYTFSDEVASTK